MSFLSCYSNLWLRRWIDLIPPAAGSAPSPVCKQQGLTRDRLNLALGVFSLFQCDFLLKHLLLLLHRGSSLRIPASLRLIPPLRSLLAPPPLSHSSLLPARFPSSLRLLHISWQDLLSPCAAAPPSCLSLSLLFGLLLGRLILPSLQVRSTRNFPHFVFSASSPQLGAVIPVLSLCLLLFCTSFHFHPSRLRRHTPFPLTHPPAPPSPHLPSSSFPDAVSSSHPCFFFAFPLFSFPTFFPLPLQIFHLARTTLPLSPLLWASSFFLLLRHGCALPPSASSSPPYSSSLISASFSRSHGLRTKHQMLER